jgi:hypothetical protein
MKIKYSLSIFDEQDNHEFLDWSEVDSLPRFEVGDSLGALFFMPMADVGQRVIVTDVKYSFISSSGDNSIRLSLRVRSETTQEEDDRQRAFQSALPFPFLPEDKSR